MSFLPLLGMQILSRQDEASCASRNGGTDMALWVLVRWPSRPGSEPETETEDISTAPHLALPDPRPLFGPLTPPACSPSHLGLFALVLTACPALLWLPCPS